MKFLDLELSPYGHFDSLKLDFSAKPCGFHLIYGKNEAGKSTTLRAIESFLFGIPARSSDNFKHEYGKLRIAARFTSNATDERTLIRRKGNKDTLMDAEGRAVDEGIIASAIGGLDRDAFSLMYGLNHAALVDGAKNLLAGGGSLGESLFQAGTGIRDFHKTLMLLEKEASDQFSSNARNKSAQFNAAKDAYTAAEEIVKKTSVAPRVFLDLETAYEKKSALVEKLRVEIRELSARKSRLERLQTLLPHYARREALLREIEALGEVRELPEDAAQIRQKTQERLNEAEALRSRLTAKLADLEERIASITVSDALIGHAEAIDALRDRLGGINKAAQDSPDVQQEQFSFEETARRVLKEIGSPLAITEVDTIRPTDPQREQIIRLIDSYRTIHQQSNTIQREIKALEIRLARANSDLDALPQALDSTALRLALETALNHLQLDAQIEETAGYIAQAEQSASLKIKQLILWAGSLDELEALAVPGHETIERFDQCYRDLSAQLAAAQKAEANCAAERENVEYKLTMHRLAGEVPTESALAEARSRRDAGWQLVRSAWRSGAAVDLQNPEYDADLSLADAFGQSITAADTVGDLLRGDANRVAEYAGLLMDLEKAQKALAAATDDLSAALCAKSALDSEWLHLWEPLSIKPLLPNEMRAWMQQRAALCADATNLRATRAHYTALCAKRVEQLNLLIPALHQIDRDALTFTLITPAIRLAQTTLARLEEEAGVRKALTQTIREITDAHQAKSQEWAQTQNDLAHWQSEWAESVTAIGLDSSAKPDTARIVLDRLTELFQAVSNADDRRGRVANMEEDAMRFASDVAAFVAHIAPDLASIPANQAVSELLSRLTQMRQDKAIRDGLAKQSQETKDALRDCTLACEAADDTLRSLIAAADCATIAELAIAEESSTRRRDLRREMETETRFLTDLQGKMPLEELLVELSAIDPDRIGAEIDDLQRAIEDRETQSDPLRDEISDLRLKLQAMDGKEDAANAALAAQEAAAQMSAAAERYVRVRMASLLLRRYMDRYREENQGPVLLKAGEIFRTLTCGGFIGLQPDFDDIDNPVLLGTRSSGAKVGVAGMSDGTRDALYLALRLASLHHHFATREPIPFIIDDILVNLDDERAGATFEVLATLAEKTQVLFFTHHDHLRALARTTIPQRLLQLHAIE